MIKSTKSQKSIKKMIAITGLCSVFMTVPAYAFNGAILSGIEINSNKNNSYNIILKADKKIQIEKEITDSNKIILDLKNVKPATFVNTIYNNTAQIDNVIIHPVSNKEVKIFIKGTNIASSLVKIDKPDTINFIDQQLNNETNKNTEYTSDENAEPLPQSITNNTEEQETITINPPISNFKPLANYDEAVQEQESESSFERIKNTLASSGFIKNLFNSSSFGWLLKLLAIGCLVFAGLNLFKSKKKSVKIDIYSDTRARELELIKELNNKRSQSLPSLNIQPKTNYNKINTEFNVRSKYGLQEYQNSQNYYQKNLNNIPILNNNIGMTKVKNDQTYNSLKTKKPAKQNQIPLKTTVGINPNKITNKNIDTAKVNINGVKFLENMAKIYEKSGRGDLAQGIQSNISKTYR